MKKITILSAFLFLVSTSLIAHPPSDIIITFDLANRTVTAKIMHDVKNIVDHYIAQAVITVNGKKVITQAASTQTSNEAQTLVYVIPGLKIGDVVSVDADCSKFGDLTKEAVVKEMPVKETKSTNNPLPVQMSKPAAKNSKQVK
jgi:predicted AAA+ superfamily ATPase